MEIAQQNRISLEALLLYLVAKLASAPRDQAAQLLDLINLDGLEAMMPPVVVPAAETAQQIADSAADAWRQLGTGDYGAGTRSARIALAGLCSLAEKGALGEVQVLVDWLLGQIAGTTPDGLLHFLGVAAGLGLSASGQAPPAPIHMAKLGASTITRGWANEVGAWLAASRHPAKALDPGGLFGFDDAAVRSAAVAEMGRDGYHRLERRLPIDMVERLRLLAVQTPGHPSWAQQAMDRMALLTFEQCSSEVDALQIGCETLLSSRDIQAVLADPSLLALAQDYLGCEPVISAPNLWWSFPTDRNPNSELAQYFHYDMDWWKFFKLFIYLTDVDEGAGPHAYIRGSHRIGAKPAELLNRGYSRIPDADLAQFYPPDDFRTVLGPAGTMAAGDTRCWHKGARPTAAPRLILQLEWTATQAHSPRPPKIPVRSVEHAGFGRLLRDFPYMTQNFILDAA